MEKALSGYCTALRYLAEKVNEQPEEFRNRFMGLTGRYQAQTLSKWIGADTMQELDQFDVQPFKDSLRFEFGALAANWLRNVDPSSVMTVSDHQPVYFCRYDTKRSYCLLYDKEKERYYAKLYLMNSSDARAAHGTGNMAAAEKLVHIHKHATVLKRTGRPETFLILPLSFGEWQEGILGEATRNPERFRTARLYRKGEDFYLAVSVETDPVKQIETEAYLGVSRGLKNRLNYTVTDLKGTVLEQGPVDIPDVYGEGCVSPAELHCAANRIGEIARRHKARVIVQNLKGGDRLNWLEVPGEEGRPRFGRREYNRFLRLLDYKLEWKGLPSAVKVSSRGIFHTCPACGLNTARNRLGMDFFICTGCGTAMDVEKLGSLNLARKLIRYVSDKIRITLTRNDRGIWFTNKQLGLSFFSEYGENQQDRVKEELRKIIEGGSGQMACEAEAALAESTKADIAKAAAIRAATVKKLKNSKDFMDMIEYK